MLGDDCVRETRALGVTSSDESDEAETERGTRRRRGRRRLGSNAKIATKCGPVRRGGQWPGVQRLRKSMS